MQQQRWWWRWRRRQPQQHSSSSSSNNNDTAMVAVVAPTITAEWNERERKNLNPFASAKHNNKCEDIEREWSILKQRPQQRRRRPETLHKLLKSFSNLISVDRHSFKRCELKTYFVSARFNRQKLNKTQTHIFTFWMCVASQVIPIFFCCFRLKRVYHT